MAATKACSWLGFWSCNTCAGEHSCIMQDVKIPLKKPCNAICFEVCDLSSYFVDFVSSDGKSEEQKLLEP
jgi:hypothetical protein